MIDALMRDLLLTSSISGSEGEIADLVEERLGHCDWLEVSRFGNEVIAHKPGSGPKVMLAGHLDTVPGDTKGRYRETEDSFSGLGAVDMKGGIAAMLVLAGSNTGPDVTYVFYTCEEIDFAANGLHRLGRELPELFGASYAILLEPTDNYVELGCQGTARVRLELAGVRAHSARPWMGINAISRAAAVVARLEQAGSRQVELAGVEFRESTTPTRIESFVANNVVPDLAKLWCNVRFAPDRTPESVSPALSAILNDLIHENDRVEVEEAVGGAMPSRDGYEPLIDRARGVRAKLGWTDVGYLAEHGITAVNFGPGDPLLAHGPNEVVAKSDIAACIDALAGWLDDLSH
jgi:succinyl-diaminopimelate desuccinylase